MLLLTLSSLYATILAMVVREKPCQFFCMTRPASPDRAVVNQAHAGLGPLGFHPSHIDMGSDAGVSSVPRLKGSNAPAGPPGTPLTLTAASRRASVAPGRLLVYLFKT